MESIGPASEHKQTEQLSARPLHRSRIWLGMLVCGLLFGINLLYIKMTVSNNNITSWQLEILYDWKAWILILLVSLMNIVYSFRTRTDSIGRDSAARIISIVLFVGALLCASYIGIISMFAMAAVNAR